MIGRISLFPAHRGEIFTDVNGKDKALCNGQIIPRSLYPLLSVYWPVGAYGSTATDMVMPNIDSHHFRMHALDTGDNIDTGFSSRTTSSGALPAQADIGTFELGDFSSNHTHASGTLTDNVNRAAVVGAPGSWAPLASITSQGPDPATIVAANPGVPIEIGAASVTVFDVAHVKFYPYISLE